MTYTFSRPIDWEKNGDTYTGRHPALLDDCIYWIEQDSTGEWRAQWGRDDGYGNFFDVCRNHDIPLTSPEEARDACQEDADKAVREMIADGAVIELTEAERQSRLDRVRWAESLIRQLPEDHEGRNSWLLNWAIPDEHERKGEAA